MFPENIVKLPVKGDKHFRLSYGKLLKDSIHPNTYNLRDIFYKGVASISSSSIWLFRLRTLTNSSSFILLGKHFSTGTILKYYSFYLTIY